MKKAYIAFAFLSLLVTFLLIGKPSYTGYQLLNTTLVVVRPELSVCNMTLEQGYNLVSFPCLTKDEAPASFFSAYPTQIISVRGYKSADTADPWKGYNPSLPAWVVQDLTLVSRSDGYWLNSQNTTNVVLGEELYLPTLYSLSPGWHLVGYPSLYDNNVSDTFAGLVPNYDYIYMYNASDTDKWKMYTWNSSLPSAQDLNYTTRYYGYWIYMHAPGGYIIS